MELRKNLEAVFLLATIVAVPASYAVVRPHATRTISASNVEVIRGPTSPAPMNVVVIKGRRLSAKEKASERDNRLR